MILIVDDDARMTETLLTILEHEGESVMLASNGVEAYGALKSHPCALMLLDVNMPELSGPELLTLMKNEDIRVPTIVMTGNADFDADALAAYPFVVGLERKPFDIMNLVARIHGCVAQTLRVVALTDTRQIEGDLALPSAVDLNAVLEQAGTFILLTNASVTPLDGGTVFAAAQLHLRVESIVCMAIDDGVPTMMGAAHASD